jgi:hypothetical protein
MLFKLRRFVCVIIRIIGRKPDMGGGGDKLSFSSLIAALGFEWTGTREEIKRHTKQVD